MALILVADDDDAWAAMIEDFLVMRTHQVVRVSNGSDAVVKVKEWRPQLIIMDVMMPGLYGTAAYKALEDAGVPSRIPVVFVTAVPLVKVRQLTPDHPRTRLLSKPVELESLGRAIDELLGSAGKPAA